MRITNKVLVNGYLGDLNTNLQNMQKLQEQLSTGKEIRRPSDDPFKVARTMELTAGIAMNERYQENIDEGISCLIQQKQP
jgi:flagellar hook-associated protein 3 FlgL